MHLLTQFVWPDDAPTGLYAEQLASALIAHGHEVRLVAGTGQYRASERSRPDTAIRRLPHYTGTRGHLVTVLAEYASLTLAFRRYVLDAVKPGDVVVVVSAPGDTIWLAGAIHARDATAVYWLQDYYPELVRSLWDPPWPARIAFSGTWDRLLARWDCVVKAAGNLGYDGSNSRVIRNWPAIDVGEPLPSIPRTALYSGNLGYIHHVPSFVEACDKLRTEGYAITVRGDGPGVARLPAWIHRAPLFSDRASLIESYWRAEVHLIAGHPRFEHAVFPSKAWNSIATGRRIVATGFGPAMQRELEISRNANSREHLSQWADLLTRIEPHRA